MSIFLTIVLITLWSFCAVGTYARWKNQTSLGMMKSIITRACALITPTFVQNLSSDNALSITKTGNDWPNWRKALQAKACVIKDEIIQHYFRCSKQCLKQRPFITRLTSHYDITYHILTFLSSVPHFQSAYPIKSCSFIYVEAGTTREETCPNYVYELCVHDSQHAGSSHDRQFIPQEVIKYENTANQPQVWIRVEYDKPVRHTNLTFFDYVQRLHQWSQH